MYEERIARAVELFKSGYNCSQAVVAAFADLYDFTPQQALRLSASFGGGIGRMRKTCGAACGMFLLAGLDCGVTDPTDRQGKSHNYAVVQALAQRFQEENGALDCATLLTGASKATPDSKPVAEPRTPAYYAKRPCAMMVESAARIFADYLTHRNKVAHPDAP